MKLEHSNLKLKLFPSSVLVKGSKRSLILDLQRKKYDLIPNTLAIILSELSGERFSIIYEKYKEHKPVLDEYFEFLSKNEHLIFSELVDQFPAISLDFHTFGSIDNCIIDINDLSLAEYKMIIQQLLSLGCMAIQLRFYTEVTGARLTSLLEITERSQMRCIDLILKFSPKIEKEVEFIAKRFQRIRHFVLHSADNDEFIHYGIIGQQFIIKYKDEIKNSTHCGVIYSEAFVMNTEMFIESNSFNSCLNRKISIDQNGDIKNCPSLPKSYGNIKDTTLKEALNHPDFKKYWNINKDQIEVCRDCEFRYICTDCRAYLEEPENIYSKPLKCGYNPYTAEWEEWSTNPLKQKAIDFYGMRELVSND